MGTDRLSTESSRSAAVEVGDVDGARAVKFPAYPTLYVDEYVTFAVSIVRKDAAAEDSLAAIRERNRFGTAIAAMIKMIATTIKSSISENPFSFLIPSLSISSVPSITLSLAWDPSSQLSV